MSRRGVAIFKLMGDMTQYLGQMSSLGGENGPTRQRSFGFQFMGKKTYIMSPSWATTPLKKSGRCRIYLPDRVR
jgi:hypothetical protein